MNKEKFSNASDQSMQRRQFLTVASSLTMGAGLIASYGVFASYAARFLYPAKEKAKTWMFVAEVSRFHPGDSMSYKDPTGATVAIARQGSRGDLSDFIALSSTCPHLGCQVHWESPQQRFFCPCHNGTFDPSGKATGGPPFEAGQSLPRYPLKIENGLLFIEVTLEKMASKPERGCEGCPRSGKVC